MSGRKVDFRVNVDTALGIVRGMFTSKREGIAVLNAIVVGPRGASAEGCDLSGVLSRAREFLIKGNALFSMIMAQDENILQAARAGRVEGGGIQDVAERIERIRALREALAEAVNVLNPRTVNSPQAYQTLDRLIKLAGQSGKARLGPPLTIVGNVTFVL